MHRGAGFIYHCAEGQVGSFVAREFVDASNAGCLEQTFVGIHCNAIVGADWQRWAMNKAGALVWSPFSNLWLYGATTDIASARNKACPCVWDPTGVPPAPRMSKARSKSPNSIGEHLSLGFTDRELVAMVTTNPGDALSRCWKKRVGRLMPAAFGDSPCCAHADPRACGRKSFDSTERDVMLVVYHGVPRYGDAGLMTTPGLAKSSAITVRGMTRRFAIADPDDASDVWSWKDITGRLEAVRKDPVAALKHADGRRRAYAGPLDAPDAPLELMLDMPSGGTPLAGDISTHAAEIVIPPLPSLVHDAAFFKSIKGRGFHGGLLDGLAGFYA